MFAPSELCETKVEKVVGKKRNREGELVYKVKWAGHDVRMPKYH